MDNSFEKYFLIRCANRISTRFPANSAIANVLSDWLEKANLGIFWTPNDFDYRRSGIPSEVWDDLCAVLVQADAATLAPHPDRLQQNVTLLADYVGLDSASARIFALSARASLDGPLDDLCNSLMDGARMRIETLIGCFTDLPVHEVSRSIGRNSTLIDAGLLVVESTGRRGPSSVVVPEGLVAALEMATDGIEDILGRLFDDVGIPSVAWQDFEHLGATRDFVARLLTGALHEKAHGINILFYGPPGTGKTEFCKVLAEYVGASLHAVGESNDDGDEPSRFDRIQQLRLGQKFLAGRGNALVLFDEMEDILNAEHNSLWSLSRGGPPTGSKVHRNRLLETNPVPTLWTCNDIDGFDPALMRRLTLAVEMRCPTQKTRARVWQRLAEKSGIALDAAACDALAQDLSEPPALAAGALRATVLAGGDIDDMRLAVKLIGKAMHGGQVRAPMALSEAPTFQLDLVNTNTDITLLSKRLSRESANRAVSLCLSGPPGTGKSAYVRYLAQEMDLPVIQKRGSDILSKWVGGTEKNIAAAFSEAQDSGAFLIFDEADSLLSSREMAERAFEISQVNEMLTWMESHPLPFACTTNLMARLDSASLRRFTFKVAFRPLTPEQLDIAFIRFFHMPAPVALTRLGNLTPGDFANVQKRITALGLSGGTAILKELQAEQAAKPDTGLEIGFRPEPRVAISSL